tara:strand:+ start:142 stop:282 length:141 start_codon:yes stop_codon:yes gene_type:complete
MSSIYATKLVDSTLCEVVIYNSFKQVFDRFVRKTKEAKFLLYLYSA